MITDDPNQRVVRLAALRELLGRNATVEERELLLAFAGVVYGEMPDRLALTLGVEVLAARIVEHFRFVAQAMPATSQLYRGLPGIHVVARNPDPETAAATGAGAGLPLETTVVETHTPDAPFIFESFKNYFQKAGLRVFAAIHPIFTARRQWERIVWIGGPHDEGTKELFCHFQIERVDSRERLRRIEREIHALLKCVFVAVEDFAEMTSALRETLPRLRSRRGDPAEVASAAAFVQWLLDDNYVFQGTVRYRVGAGGLPERLDETASGVFTDPALLPVVFPGLIEEIESHARPAHGDDRIIDIDYCNNAAAIYQREPIDDILIREWGPDGELLQTTVLLGRLAKGAFTQKAAGIPLLREKQDWLLAQSAAIPKSHAYRETLAVFNRFPTRELFYADVGSLKGIIDRIVYMAGDDEIAVHCRPGAGYWALSIAFSRLRYSYKVEEDLRDALAQAFGPISFSSATDCGAVTLLLCYFDSARLDRPLEVEAVRRLTASLVTTWEDRVAEVLVEAFGEREGRRLFTRYVRADSRSGLYREATPPAEVPDDLRHLEVLESRLEVGAPLHTARGVILKLYSVKALGLTDTLRTLQNLGLTVAEELRIPVLLPEGRRGFVYRFEIEAPPDRLAALDSGQERFAEALRALDEGRATDDPLSALVLAAGLGWREVEVLRTLRNHLLQIRTHYNVGTVNGVLLRNVEVAAALVRAFQARFDPAASEDREAAITASDAEVHAALESVQGLAEDEVLRALENLLRAALRTNFYQRPERPVVAIKVDSRRVEGMRSPRPLVEIYVHSRQLEGIHLRGGRVARGGIRWSDRHDDFRTEILGLMKTQMVKNAIIVPVGSKGGFVLKGAVPSRPALDAYLVDRYREFVSGLLDVTDNVVGGKVIHPPEVVRHDGDDPYLVVAADKGTAHLSDTANSVSTQYGFWLGDAFASGGSHGYDHKKVGITARGTWECVKEHFRNLGVDVERQPFTLVGIGDMSGDVFGNGMLQSRTMRLCAAFNHAHIFVDPSPDPEVSFRERERLFRLPRSTWREYDPVLISAGGGVFDRSAKAIPVSAEMRRLLDLDGEVVSGEQLIRRILTARVDLLYNGGIGTYVKASAEDDVAVGDRTNDAVRVDARDVRARVVAEGGNLGFTQKARIEYWARGGLINTDAVDNSGGVDMSDHEVNIKILLDMLVKRGVIRNGEERNRVLAAVTEEVARLVLADNQGQARGLSLDGRRSAQRYEEFVALIETMVREGILSRVDDAVPRRDDLLASPERARGLPRPLLALVMGHVKMRGFASLVETEFPDSPTGRVLLEGYFPGPLRERFGRFLGDHALSREIVATLAVNRIVNQAGVGFLARMMAESGAGIAAVVTAYLEGERDSGAPAARAEIVTRGLAAATEYERLLGVEDALEAAVRARLGGRSGDPGGALVGIRARPDA